MKRIIPNKTRYLEISTRAAQGKESHVVVNYNRKERKLVIKGLEEYFKTERAEN